MKGLLCLAALLISVSSFAAEAPSLFCQKKYHELKWEEWRVQIYRLRAERFPSGEKYYLMIRNFDGSESKMFAYQANRKGHLILDLQDDLKKAAPYIVTPLRKGEKVIYNMVSDQGEQIAAPVIPFPIETKGKKGAVLSLELKDMEGRSFECVGKGFNPESALLVMRQTSEGEVEQWVKTDKSGVFSFPFKVDEKEDSGKSQMLISLEKEKIVLSFEWGKLAQEFVGACCLEIK